MTAREQGGEEETVRRMLASRVEAGARSAASDALRGALVEALRSKDCLRSPALAEAFAAVPRHLFIPHVPVEEAYRDSYIVTKRLPDGEAVSSCSQPYIMAVMLDQLDVRPGHRVLEIGAGTGYNAALLAHLVGAGGRVTTIDIDADTVTAARAHLDAAGVTGVRVMCGDGWAGDPEGGPYDRIILTVNADDISPAWRAQLAPGGRLVLPLSLAAVQASVAFENLGDQLDSLSVRPCIFMRLRGASASPRRRVAVGPEPAPAVWPRGSHTVDGAAIHALVRAPGHDVPTGLVLPASDLYGGLASWLGLHVPTSAWFIAEGDAVKTGLVPALFDGTGEAASTFGFFEPDGVALLIRAAAPPGLADGTIYLGVRAYGNLRVGERLRSATQAWDKAGRPPVDRLRIRAYPIESPYAPRSGDIVRERPCTRLVLAWPP